MGFCILPELRKHYTYDGCLILMFLKWPRISDLLSLMRGTPCPCPKSVYLSDKGREVASED